jgi:hypothetical protein
MLRTLEGHSASVAGAAVTADGKVLMPQRVINEMQARKASILDSLPIVFNTRIQRKKRAPKPHRATLIRSSSLSPKVEAFVRVVTSPARSRHLPIICESWPRDGGGWRHVQNSRGWLMANRWSAPKPG